MTDLVFLSLQFDKLLSVNKLSTRRLLISLFSMFPKYGRMYTSVWPILNGENVSGVTLHEIDGGIVTGNMIDQRASTFEEFQLPSVLDKKINSAQFLSDRSSRKAGAVINKKKKTYRRLHGRLRFQTTHRLKQMARRPRKNRSPVGRRVANHNLG